MNNPQKKYLIYEFCFTIALIFVLLLEYFKLIPVDYSFIVVFGVFLGGIYFHRKMDIPKRWQMITFIISIIIVIVFSVLMID